MKNIKIISILILFLFFISPVNSAISDELIGITWCGKYEKQKKKKDKHGNKTIYPGPSELISFSPLTGTIKKKLLQLDKKECFRGLAYDSKNKKLYALSQSNWNLYSINPLNLQTKLIGKLDIENLPLGKNSRGKDIGGLTYDPGSGILYASVSHWNPFQTNIWSELVTFDPGEPGRVKKIGKKKARMIEVKSVGLITCGYISSISFNEDDGQIYAFAVDKSGSWESSYKSSLVRINPENADMTKLFETPYHTILGLARKPAQKLANKSREIVFYSWVNKEKHYYAQVDVIKKSITILGSSDSVGVNSDAMLMNPFKRKNP